MVHSNLQTRVAHISIYNPPINFCAILLSVLGHVVANRKAIHPFHVNNCPTIFQWRLKNDKFNKVSLVSVFIFLIISNGGSKNKLVLYNPVTKLKFWTSRYWQVWKVQRNHGWAKFMNYINALLKKLTFSFYAVHCQLWKRILQSI